MPTSSRLPATLHSVPTYVEGPQCRWTIVIAGTASKLPEKLLGTSESQRLLVLESDASSDEDALPPSMLELLAETVRHRDVGAIVVFGQSKDAGARSKITSNTQSDSTSSYSRLLRRMSDRIKSKRRAQNRVRVRLNQIRVDSRMAGALILQGISLWGLYHVSESDAFMLYDQAEDRFVPLVDTTGSCS